jgi:hypothetical protein
MILNFSASSALREVLSAEYQQKKTYFFIERLLYDYSRGVTLSLCASCI